MYNTKDPNNNPQIIDKKFLDELFEFIHSVESEMDIMLPESASLQYLSYCKIIDYLISQKLSKNIIIKVLCPFDEKGGKLIKQIIPFIGYKSIKLSSPKTAASSLLFIRDKQDVFSFSIDIQQDDKENNTHTTDSTSPLCIYLSLYLSISIFYVKFIDTYENKNTIYFLQRRRFGFNLYFVFIRNKYMSIGKNCNKHDQIKYLHTPNL